MGDGGGSSIKMSRHMIVCHEWVLYQAGWHRRNCILVPATYFRCRGFFLRRRAQILQSILVPTYVVSLYAQRGADEISALRLAPLARRVGVMLSPTDWREIEMKKKITALMMAAGLVFLTACTSSNSGNNQSSSESGGAASEAGETITVGICNYVDDASLNQIYANIEAELAVLGEANGVNYEILYDNCQADSNLLNQIVANFISDNVDVMVGIATPVAMAMQAATEDNQIPVVFSAVSDPVGVDLVASLESPGANITGTSDYLNTNAIMELIFAENPDTDLVGLLYDVGQDSSTQAIIDAKAFLDAKGVKYVEKMGTTVDEVMLAAESLVNEGVDAIFTPTDNTIMTAELSIYESFAEAGIKHYAGANSFALNGAFLGYGVDYANLGVETARMVNEIAVNKKDPATLSVMTFDNGIATINTDIVEVMGLDLDGLKSAFADYCTSIVEIQTAEEFE